MNAIRLRPEQQRVVEEYKGGFAAISAVPGAGKTTTLSALAANLIERIFPRQRVVIVTYQNAAVANFQSAISNRLRERGLPERGFIVRTLHGLANDVLTTAGYRVNLDAEAQVVDEMEADALLYSIIEGEIQRHYSDLRDLLEFPDLPAARQWPDRRILYDIVRECLREIKQNPVDFEALSLRMPAGDRWMPFVLDVLRAYELALNQLGRIDFDDMILRAVVALENDDLLCNRLRSRWPYLLEDEAQDSTPLQERMLLRIAGEGGNLVRVGDANQAILTTFTSSDVKSFRRWLDRSDVQQFVLQGSSRSTQAVVELANRFMEVVRNDFPVETARTDALDDLPISLIGAENPALPGGGRRTGLTVKVFQNTDDERDDVVRRAIAHLRRSPRDRVAILVGGREPGYQYCQHAVDLGFPNERIIRLLGGNDGRPISLVDRLLPLIEYLQEPDAGHRLARALRGWSPLDQDDAVVRAVNQLSSTSSPTISAVLYPPPGIPIRAGFDFDALLPEERDSLLRLEAVPLWLVNRLAQPHELLSLFSATLYLDEEDRVLLNRVAATAQSIEPNPELDRLTQLRRFLIDLRHRRRQLRGTPEEYAIKINPGTLTVSTRHQAKGLEWDIVFAVGCDDFWFPGSLDIVRLSQRDYLGPTDPVIEARTELKFLQDGNPYPPSRADVLAAMEIDAQEQVAERLRVMYVTITRAKRGLWVSWHRQGYTAANRPMPRKESPLIVMLRQLVREVEHAVTS